MSKSTEHRGSAFYLGLNYPVTVYTDPDGGFVAEIEDLPGCMTQAESHSELFSAIEEARQLWIQTAYEDGQDIPLPRDAEECKGKFMVRIPRTLHRNLSRAAKREGVSLNQYVSALLAAGVHGDTVVSQVNAIIIEATREVHAYTMVYGFEKKQRQFIDMSSMEKQEIGPRG